MASGRWKLVAGSLASFRIAAREEGVAMADIRMLECRGRRRSFGDLVAAGGMGFRIGAGETYGLLGPDGAGKTTTMSMIAGLLAFLRSIGAPGEGHPLISFHDEDARRSHGRRTGRDRRTTCRL